MWSSLQQCYVVSYYSHFTDGETSLSKLCDLLRAREQEDSNPDLSNRKAWDLAPHVSQTPARGLPEAYQPTLPIGPEPGLQGIPLSPFHGPLGLGCPLGQQSLGSMPSIASLPCWPCTRFLAPEARLRLPWQCPTPGLPPGPHKPLECLRNPTLQASIQTASPRQPLSSQATGKSFQFVS